MGDCRAAPDGDGRCGSWGEEPMREIVVDTETTGLDPQEGHRIVEIACLELVHHVPTGRKLHRYINPERDIPAESLAVHGLAAAFLAGHPPFAPLSTLLFQLIHVA